MTADDSTPQDGENVTDAQRDDLDDDVTELGAATTILGHETARYADDYDLSNVDEWEPLGNGSWWLDAPDAIDAEGRIEAPHVDAGVELGADAPAWANVWYSDGEGVSVGVERERDADDVYVSARATFDTDAARDLAATIYQAAEELDRRREAEADA